MVCPLIEAHSSKLPIHLEKVRDLNFSPPFSKGRREGLCGAPAKAQANLP
jgi:hypothetical protein